MESEREKLVKEIRCNCTDKCQHPKWDEVEPLADFILADRRRVLEEIEVPLKSASIKMRNLYQRAGVYPIPDKTGVDVALSKIQELKGEA